MDYDALPDSSEVKFLILRDGCWNYTGWNRNQDQIQRLPSQWNFTQPNTLDNLDSDLYQCLVKDLQLVTKNHQTRIRIVLGCSCFVLVLFLYVYAPYNSSSVLYGSLSMALLVLFIGWWITTMLDETNIEATNTIEEWKPLFLQNGFTLDYKIEKSCCFDYKSYVGIRNFSGDIPDPQDYSMLEEEGVKYVLFNHIAFPRRNKAFRFIPKSVELRYWVLVKPPALKSLSDEVFRDFMQDLSNALQVYNRFRQNIIFVFMVIWTISNIFSWTIYVFWPLVLIAMIILENIAWKVPILDVIAIWKPRMEEHGFAVEYKIDKPFWYSRKEWYIHIYRKPPSLAPIEA